ncbi:MAG: glycosyltransferase family 4 protein [Christensenellales bacterium]|nr:glycosyltransferase family 4 protein [Christensenellales bacterium]
MKKVCFIVYDMTVSGGVEQVTASLSAAFCDLYEVHVLGILQTGMAPNGLDSRVQYAYLTDAEKPFSVLQRELRKPIADYMRRNGVDVCIVQGTFPAFIAFPARFFCRTRFVFCDHGALVNQWHERAPTIARFLASLFCHKTVTLTEKTYRDYRARFRVPKRKLACIYNWIEPSHGFSTEYDMQSKRIVSAGRIGREKGFDLLVKAMVSVAEKHPDWSLDIFGDGDRMTEIRRLVKEYRLEDQIHFLGMRSDLKERYKEYAMYVLPSYREGMPLVLLEAKQNRLPIVSFDIHTGPREIVRDGVDGLLIPPYDTEEFGRGINRLIEDSELRREMSCRSQDNLEKFSKQTILKQWMELVNSLVNP